MVFLGWFGFGCNVLGVLARRGCVACPRLLFVLKVVEADVVWSGGFFLSVSASPAASAVADCVYSNLLNTRYGYIKQHGTQKVDLIKFVMDEIINMAFQ